MARKTATPTRPATPPRVFRDVPLPLWYSKEQTYGNACQLSVRSLLRHDIPDWTLPPFQREVVWSAEKQVAFCNTIVDGLPSATVLVWHRFMPGVGRVPVLLDGQQRLTAMGAKIRRADGTMNPPAQAFFDPATGRFTTDPGRWAITMKDVVNHDYSVHRPIADELEKTDLEGYDLWEGLIYARDMVGDRQLPFYILDERATLSYAMDAFRAINRPGIQFDEAEVGRLITAAADFK